MLVYTPIAWKKSPFSSRQLGTRTMEPNWSIIPVTSPYTDFKERHPRCVC